MDFGHDNSIEKNGVIAGYILGYLLFTTTLFLVLFWLKKIPASWSFLQIMGVTLLITLTGLGIKRILK